MTSQDSKQTIIRRVARYSEQYVAPAAREFVLQELRSLAVGAIALALMLIAVWLVLG